MYYLQIWICIGGTVLGILWCFFITPMGFVNGNFTYTINGQVIAAYVVGVAIISGLTIFAYKKAGKKAVKKTRKRRRRGSGLGR
jgi:hypothetical protein